MFFLGFSVFDRRRTIDRLMRFVMSQNHRSAKFSARLLTALKNAEELCEQVVNVSPSSALKEYGPQMYTATCSL